MLFVHAATGCDNTSAVYRKGKRVPFRKREAQPSLCTAMQIFNDPQSSRNAIAAAGEAFLCVVYGGKIDDNLDVKGHQLHLRTIAKQKVCAKCDLATLLPISAQHVNTRFRYTTKYSSVVVSPWILSTGDGN